MNALVIVDPQNDFINGSLAVPGAEKAINNTIEFIKEHKEDLAYIAITADWHPYDHCSFKEPGNSMLPLYKSNEEHLLTPITWEQCKVGDVVFCKVKGSCLTHKVYAIDSKKGCLIGNNKGHMNGWTKNVYGLAHKLKK